MSKPILLLLLALPAGHAAAQEANDGVPARAPDTNWPSFRGTNAGGVADGYATPATWDVDGGTNIAWKTEVPGLAHSSPVVWGDRIYLTTAVKEGKAELTVGLYGSITPVADEGEHDFNVLCLDKTTGQILWTNTAWHGVPKIKRHPKGSHAASTPATDGEHVVAFFGTEGLYCYDRDGELLWKKEFGVLDSGYFKVPAAQWGFASSPVIHGGKVILQVDVQGDDFVAALDVKTGDEIWRTARDEVPTWSTPTVHAGQDRGQVICNGYMHIGGYDLATGEELWKIKGRGGDIPVPTPIVARDLIFIMNAHGRMSPILAISTRASGAVSMSAGDSEHMIWSHRRGASYMQTPVVYGDLLYSCRDNGALSCIEARTGKRLYRERLGGGRIGFTASGVAADGKLYFPSEDGEIQVVKAGREFELLARNALGETCMATPAISAGTLYFRTRHHLIAVANDG